MKHSLDIMKWIAVVGSWRKYNDQIKRDVQTVVRKILLDGDGIVTGGALGIDYFATQTILDMKKTGKHIRIFLPIKLTGFCKHYRRRADEGVITHPQADMIITQLKKVYKINKKAIIDNTRYAKANIESYYARNTEIVKSCNEVYAFQVNDSKGVQDVIDKARKLRKVVHVKKYVIP